MLDANEVEQDLLKIVKLRNRERLFFFIINKHSGRCLDVANFGTNNGEKIQQWGWHGGDNQRWRLERIDSGTFRIFSKHSGKCLDVPGASCNQGENLQLWEESNWNGGVQQHWIIADLGYGFYQIVARHSNQCLDVTWVSLDDGAAAIQWPWHGGDNQQWKISLTAE